MDALNQAGQTPAVPQKQDTPAPAPKETPVAEPKEKFEKTKVADPHKMTGIWKAVDGGSKTLFAGFGLGSGAVGGFAIGGALGTGANIITALFKSSLTLAGATSAGLFGGIVGACLFGVCGMLGGYQFGHGIVKGAHSLYEKFAHQG